VMIWTRLAPKPLEPDGGMTGIRTAVTWQVADDEAFTKIVKQGRATAAPELGYSVHVDVDGLEPDRWYFYRFTSMDATSAVGRTRTAPAAGSTKPLRFVFNSCQNYEDGLYTALDHQSREELDLVTHLGDYIYEYGPHTVNKPRSHNAKEIITLDDYRARYALYKSDPMLQAAHRACPWLVTWDDHEVDNNYAGGAGATGENNMESDEQMHARRAAAYQAWWENQPVRVPRVKSWADLTIIRSFEWGSLAKFYMMDSRQYRSDQACGDAQNVNVPCGDWADPSRTMLGAKQEAWITNGLATSHARWQILGNNTMLNDFDMLPGKDNRQFLDSWGGYPAARKRFVDSIARHAPNRSVVITGDNHANWVNDIHAPVPNGKVVTTEFVGTSISSGGNGAEHATYITEAAYAENPNVKWQNSRRGYVVCEVAPDTFRAQFKTVEYVDKPGAPIQTPTAWRLEGGRAGVVKE